MHQAQPPAVDDPSRERTCQTGEELDRRIRQILIDVTPETSLQATRYLVALGFTAAHSFEIVCQVIKEQP